MSDNEEVYEQFKEVKWMEWCEDVMMDEERTLKRLQKLQTTSADLPKEKVDLLTLYSQQIWCDQRSFSSIAFLVTLFSSLSGTLKDPKVFATCWQEN